VICPLCRQRKARRACPGIGGQICAVCCGTKRLTEIQCPPDCGYLIVAREHPPASVVRRQQRDLALVARFVRDFSERQSQLFVALASAVVRHRGSELAPLIDDDVSDAASALAATYETAARGVIYEHRPATSTGERLAAELKPLLARAADGGGTTAEREAATVLRRIVDNVSEARRVDPENRRAYLELLGRVLSPAEHDGRGSSGSTSTSDGAAGEPRLIIP
jgi:hypothetical protein